MIEEVVHNREHACIIARCSHHDGRIAESVLDDLSHIVATQIAHHHLLGALLAEYLAQTLGSSSRSTVNAGIGDEYALTLGLVLAPNIIESHSLSQCLAFQHRTMQRTDGLNIDCSHLFHHTLHLRTILAADIEIVTASLASPITYLVHQRTKLSESISREQHLIQAVVAHNDLRPMHHRC